MTTYAEDLAVALALTDRADAITLSRFRAQDLQIRTKPDRSPVTDVDVATEAEIRRGLATSRAVDAIAGEEEGGDPTVEGRVWIVDPIDGTKNFLRGMPVWATLIALAVDGVPVVGVASAPALRRRWWATLDGGAWTSDGNRTRRISVSEVGSVTDASVSTTEITSWDKHHSASAYRALLDNCWQSRAWGDFWQHCLVAEGVIDVAAEPVVNPWDLAALQVIVEQAGGRFTDLTGTRTFAGGTALSTNGRIHDEALALLAG